MPFDRWRELNADGVDRRHGAEDRRPACASRCGSSTCARGSRRSAREYTGSVANPRLYAHTISDEIHQQQRALRGVARTKLTFNSDRDGERMAGTVENRGVKEIYIADYDGENQRRVTTQPLAEHQLRPGRPTARSIAYTSYRRGPPNIFISNIYQGTLEELTKGARPELAAGVVARRHAHRVHVDPRRQLRDLRHEPRRLEPAAADEPSRRSTSRRRGRRPARRSRSRPTAPGTPQIYVIGADGLGLRQLTHESYADRPTWSPAPYNEIAYAARTGPGNDIKVLDLATRRRCGS